MAIRFAIYGLLGWCLEIVWTAGREKVRGAAQGWSLRGTTFLWMFFIYGLLAPFFEPVHDLVRRRPAFGQRPPGTISIVAAQRGRLQAATADRRGQHCGWAASTLPAGPICVQ